MSPDTSLKLWNAAKAGAIGCIGVTAVVVAGEIADHPLPGEPWHWAAGGLALGAFVGFFLLRVDAFADMDGATITVNGGL